VALRIHLIFINAFFGNLLAILRLYLSESAFKDEGRKFMKKSIALMLIIFCSSSFAQQKQPQSMDRSRKNIKLEKIEKSPIAVMEYVNYTGRTDISKHVWDDSTNPKFMMLREKYGLDKVVENGKTEFEKMLLLLDWVSSRWKHSGQNAARKHSALWILAEVDGGIRFRCVEYAIVLTNCLTVLGYPARTLGLQREGVAFGSGKGHVCAEIWSNQYQKWILLDGQNNAYWMKGGIPLSALECQNFFVQGRKDELEMVTQKVGANAAFMKRNWVVYFYHLKFSYNNTFFSPEADHSSFSPYRFELLSEGVHPEIFYQGRASNAQFTDCVRDAYPRLNQTTFHLFHSRFPRKSNELTIKLEHTMPFFDRFMLRIDSENWESCGRSFSWLLKEGINTIEVKAVNCFGIEGSISKITLKNNIDNIEH